MAPTGPAGPRRATRISETAPRPATPVREAAPAPLRNAVLTDEQFQMLLARVSENAAAAAPAPPAVPVEPSREQALTDYVYGTGRRRPPPFDADTLLTDMALDRMEDEMRRNVTTRVKAELAADRAARQRQR